MYIQPDEQANSNLVIWSRPRYMFMIMLLCKVHTQHVQYSHKHDMVTSHTSSLAGLDMDATVAD